MNWKPEFYIKSENAWYRNGLTFATKEECDKNAYEKYMAWLGAYDWRSVEVDPIEFPVNYRYVNGVLEYIK